MAFYPKNGTLVRPLLFLNRHEVKNIIDENSLAYVEDSSNASVKYARNKIRLEVVPKLKELNPALEHTFEKNLGHFRDLELFLEQQVATLKKELFKHKGDEIHISIEALKKLEPKRLLIYKLLQEFGFNETVTDDLIEALDKHAGRVFESAGYRLLLDRGTLILAKLSHGTQQEVIVSKNEREVSYAGYKLSILHDDSPLIVKNNPMAVSIDTDLLIYPITLRPWKQGDRFYPLGMRKAKKISDFFIDQKVPLHEKEAIPLLVNGNGDIIWIGGYRPDDRYKVSDNTKKVTIFELSN